MALPLALAAVATTTEEVAAIITVEAIKTDTKKITAVVTSMNAGAEIMIRFGARAMTTMTIIRPNSDMVLWKIGPEVRRVNGETMIAITMVVMMAGPIVAVVVIKVVSIRITEGPCHTRNSTKVVARDTKTTITKIRGGLVAMIDVMMTTEEIRTIKEVNAEAIEEATPTRSEEAAIEAAIEAATEAAIEVAIEEAIEATNEKTITRDMTSARPKEMDLEREMRRDIGSKNSNLN